MNPHVVIDEIRRGKDCVVTRIQNRERGKHEGLVGTGRHDHLVRAHLDMKVFAKAIAEHFSQAEKASVGGISVDAWIGECATGCLERHGWWRKAGNGLTEADYAVSRLPQRCRLLIEDVEGRKDEAACASGNK
jgi:hypothetical protein